MEDFIIISEIGSGTNGTVYKAKVKKEPNYIQERDEKEIYYAIKEINLQFKSKDSINEVSMLK